MAAMQDRSNRDAGKPPSRLQKRAPANLQVAGDEDISPSPCAIPLLSPLILNTPPLLPVIINEGVKQEQGNKEGGSLSSNGWQHPASSSLAEPSSLYSSFQLQCALSHNPQ